MKTAKLRNKCQTPLSEQTSFEFEECSVAQEQLETEQKALPLQIKSRAIGTTRERTQEQERLERRAKLAA